MPPRKQQQQYDNTNRISLWEQESDKPGDLTGTLTIEIDGVPHEAWVTLWENANGGGSTPVLSGSVKLKEQQRRQDGEARRGPNGGGGGTANSGGKRYGNRGGGGGGGGYGRQAGGTPREQDTGNDPFPDDDIPF